MCMNKSPGSKSLKWYWKIKAMIPHILRYWVRDKLRTSFDQIDLMLPQISLWKDTSDPKELNYQKRIMVWVSSTNSILNYSSGYSLHMSKLIEFYSRYIPRNSKIVHNILQNLVIYFQETEIKITIPINTRRKFLYHTMSLHVIFHLTLEIRKNSLSPILHKITYIHRVYAV